MDETAGVIFGFLLIAIILKFMTVYFAHLPLPVGAVYVLLFPIILTVIVMALRNREDLRALMMFFVLILGLVDATLFASWIFLENPAHAWMGALILGVLAFLTSLISFHYLTEACQKKRPDEVCEALEKFKKSVGENELSKLIDKLTEKDYFLNVFTFPVLYLTIRRAIVVTVLVVHLYLLSVVTLSKDFWTAYAGGDNVTEFIKVVWNENPFVSLFMYAYFTAIAFYFGSRALETLKLMKK